MKKIKTAFIEGRPKSHPTHCVYASSINSTFHFVDFKLRYHDLPNTFRLKRYFSWFICALFFPKRNTYDVFLSEEAYFMLGLMKRLRLINKKQKLVSIMGSHTLYFMHTNMYSKFTKKNFIKLFNNYDAFICEGPIQYEILKMYLKPNSKIKVYKIFNGSPDWRFNKLIKIKPKLNKLNIVTIGAMPNSNRMYYKGIDLMLEAYSKVKNYYPALTFTIVGEYDASLMSALIKDKCANYVSDIILTGQSTDLSESLQEACLYLHIARGEAWGISVTEAMSAGVVPIVSEWTGAKEAVEKVSKELIVKLNAENVSNKILWYLNLDLDEKKNFSVKCKEVASYYTESRAIENFKNIYYKLCNELN